MTPSEVFVILALTLDTLANFYIIYRLDRLSGIIE